VLDRTPASRFEKAEMAEGDGVAAWVPPPSPAVVRDFFPSLP